MSTLSKLQQLLARNLQHMQVEKDEASGQMRFYHTKNTELDEVPRKDPSHMLSLKRNTAKSHKQHKKKGRL